MLPATTDDARFSCLSPRSLFRFGAVNREEQLAVQSYERRAFSIEDLLLRYFNDAQCIEFRTLQATTGTLISGSTAVEFFDRSRYTEHDLDLFVEHDQAIHVGTWLMQIGYRFVRTGSQDAQFLDAWTNEATKHHPHGHPEYAGQGIVSVFNFRRNDPSAVVQVVTSRHSAFELVLGFHSTCVMNFITHANAYSLYAHATFVQRRSLARRITSENEVAARTKYRQRGWTFPLGATGAECVDPRSDFGEGLRRVGDDKCWVIPLTVTLGLPGDSITSNSWQNTHSVAPGPRHRLFIRKFGVVYERVKPVGLRFHYIIAPGVESSSEAFCPRPDLSFAG